VVGAGTEPQARVEMIVPVCETALAHREIRPLSSASFRKDRGWPGVPERVQEQRGNTHEAEADRPRLRVPPDARADGQAMVLAACGNGTDGHDDAGGETTTTAAGETTTTGTRTHRSRRTGTTGRPASRRVGPAALNVLETLVRWSRRQPVAPPGGVVGRERRRSHRHVQPSPGSRVPRRVRSDFGRRGVLDEQERRVRRSHGVGGLCPGHRRSRRSTTTPSR
jgi:hypothetical protein